MSEPTYDPDDLTIHMGALWEMVCLATATCATRDHGRFTTARDAFHRVLIGDDDGDDGDDADKKDDQTNDSPGWLERYREHQD